MTSPGFFSLRCLSLVICYLIAVIAEAGMAEPHAVFVVGTPHYNPGGTLPGLAKQLEQAGFRTTVLQAEGNPEKK